MCQFHMPVQNNGQKYIVPLSFVLVLYIGNELCSYIYWASAFTEASTKLACIMHEWVHSYTYTCDHHAYYLYVIWYNHIYKYTHLKFIHILLKFLWYIVTALTLCRSKVFPALVYAMYFPLLLFSSFILVTDTYIYSLQMLPWEDRYPNSPWQHQYLLHWWKNSNNSSCQLVCFHHCMISSAFSRIIDFLLPSCKSFYTTWRPHHQCVTGYSLLQDAESYFRYSTRQEY